MILETSNDSNPPEKKTPTSTSDRRRLVNALTNESFSACKATLLIFERPRLVQQRVVILYVLYVCLGALGIRDVIPQCYPLDIVKNVEHVLCLGLDLGCIVHGHSAAR